MLVIRGLCGGVDRIGSMLSVRVVKFHKAAIFSGVYIKDLSFT